VGGKWGDRKGRPRNIYSDGGSLSLENLAAQLYIPNYLSFESAMARHGILNLIPYTLSFATTRKTRKYTLQNQEVEFRQISRQLFLDMR